MSLTGPESRRLALGWAACAAILVAVEIALWMVPARALLSYNQQDYNYDKGLDYRTVNRASAMLDPPDIAIIGNSRPLRIIDVPLLKETLAAQGVSVDDVRNYSCPGARARTQYVLVRQLRLAGRLPRTIVWGVSPMEFLHGSRPDVERSFTAFLSLLHLVVNDPPIDLRHRIELVPPTAYATAERCIRTLSLREILRVRNGPLGPALGGTGSFHVQDKADHAAGQDRCFVMSGREEFRVNRFLWYEEIRGETCLDLTEKILGEEAVRLAREGGSEVVLVEVPVSPMLQEEYPGWVYSRFLDTCKGIAKRQKVRFISVKDLGLVMEDREYKDFGHANWLGVEKFTVGLAKGLAAQHDMMARKSAR
jgi:hypothetical protein